MREYGVKKIYWYYDAFQNTSKQEIDFFDNQCVDLSEWGDLIMPHIELHISDKCNLNCRGCAHFSPLYDEINADFEKKIADIKAIKNLFDDVLRVDILGGEPLLNSELKKYVIELRKILPRSFIQVYTNGLLIPKLDDDVLEEMKKNNIGMSISEYKPTHEMIDLIRTRLDEYNIRYYVAELCGKQSFNKPLSISSNSRYPRMCISDGCITVSNGRIARCPTLMYIEKFNEYFDQNLPTDGIFNISDYKSGEELLVDMKKEVPLCKHCVKNEMEWSVCKAQKQIEDFATYD